MHEVFLQWRQDEVKVGTYHEVLEGHVNIEAIMKDIITEMMYQGEDKVSISIVIR